jgi:hypothetical protein
MILGPKRLYKRREKRFHMQLQNHTFLEKHNLENQLWHDQEIIFIS